MLGVTAGCAALFLVLLARLALLLGATPVGGMTPEIVYLRSDLFRPLLRIVVAFLVLEGVEFVLPFAVGVAGLRVTAADIVQAQQLINLVQAVLLLALALGLQVVFQRYSRRSLERLEELPRRALEVVAGKSRRRSQQRRASR